MNYILLSCLVVGLTVVYIQFSGSPSRFQLKRTYQIANFLRLAIEKAKREEIVDEFGNLDVEARNSWFWTYQGFYQRDVECVAAIIAAKTGFRKAYVDFAPGVTTFRFKQLQS